jgi:uncharacterized membrane protein
MNCPKCNLPTEDGAAFCGNCGQQLGTVTAATTVAAMPSLSRPLPGYAAARPGQHTGEVKALLSLLFGITGLVGAVFMAVLGLLLGVAGIITGTMSRSSKRRRLSTMGLVLSSLSVLAGMAVWIYAIKHQPVTAQTVKTNPIPSAISMVSADLTTPCYSLSFVDRLNISNNSGNCSMTAFNGQSLDSSTNAYKIYASQSQVHTESAFNILAKKAIEKDVHDTLPSFSVNKELVTTFAGSPAYAIYVADTAHNISLVEEAVLHQTTAGDNVFIMIHASNGSSIDLNILESQWQWK